MYDIILQCLTNNLEGYDDAYGNYGRGYQK